MSSFETKVTDCLGVLAENQRYLVGATQPSESLGEYITKHDNVQNLLSGRTKSTRIDLSPMQFKTAITRTSAQNDPLTLTTHPAVAPLARRKLLIRDLLPQARTSEAAIEFPIQATETDNAGPQGTGSPIVTENVTLPESGATFTLSYVPVRTLGHFIPVSKNVLQDSDVLDAFLAGTLLANLRKVEDSQLLNGAGTGGDLDGLLTNATAYTVQSPQLSNEIDVVRDMIEQLQVADYSPSAIVMNPVDWYSIDVRKRGASDDAYAGGDPRTMGSPTLWGLPVAVTNSIAAGTVLVADFAAAATLFDREQASVELGFHDSTNFQTGMVTIRAVERLALVVTNSGAALTATI